MCADMQSDYTHTHKHTHTMESCIGLIVGGVDRQAIGLHPALTAGHPSVTKHTAPPATPPAVCFRKAAQSQLKYT